MSKITFNGITASEMSKERLVKYTMEHKHKYISSLEGEGENGQRLYDCLLDLVENGVGGKDFSAQDLHDHGMSDQKLL